MRIFSQIKLDCRMHLSTLAIPVGSREDVMGVGVKEDVAPAALRGSEAVEVTDALNLALPLFCHSKLNGHRLAIAVDGVEYTYARLLGAAWAGGTYVPLNPKQPAARLESILRRAGLDAVIVDKKGAAVLKDLGDARPSAVLIASDVAADTVMPPGATPWSALDTLSPLVAPRPVTPDHAAYIMFTS